MPLPALCLSAFRCPSACQVCGTWPAVPLCEACIGRFRSAAPRCTRCATPLAAGICLPCTASPGRPQGPDTCRVAVDYHFPWDGLVQRFKFHAEPGWARPFADLLLRAPGVAEAWQAADCVAPIPLMPQRLAERGHHAPWELVKALQRRHRRPATADALVRLSEGPAQHRLGREERLRNLSGAFAVPPRHAARLAGARVLLVDDVTTTGATLQAAAQALRAVGVARVDALAFARTPAPQEGVGLAL